MPENPTQVKHSKDSTAKKSAVIAFPTQGIQINHRQLPEVRNDALRALGQAHQDDPTLFAFGTLLVRLVGQHTQRLTPPALRGMLADAATWFRWVESTSSAQDVFPPMDIVQDLLALPTTMLEQFLPGLDRVATIPVLVRAPNGQPEIITTPGYHESARVYYAPDASLASLQVPAHPTNAEVAGAKSLICDELLGDFPFQSDSDRAHAVARILLPFARSAIDGPTPIHAIDAPEAGTGKGLLNDACAIVTTGQAAATIPEGGSDEEYRKKITSALVRNLPEITIDNVNQKVASGALASAITSPKWQDRFLGTNDLSEVPNVATWIMTGNNLQFSHENARRAIWIRLDSGQAHPEDRQGFRHPHLIAWARDHRADLVRAVLVLIQYWIDAAEPPGTGSLGSFESWAQIVGGILWAAEIPGFLANRQDMYAMADAEGSQWEEFVQAWAERYQDHLVSLSDLWDLAGPQALLATVVGSGNEKSQKTRLGTALASKKETHFGAYQIHYVGADRKGGKQYRLLRQEPPAESEPIPEAPPENSEVF